MELLCEPIRLGWIRIRSAGTPNEEDDLALALKLSLLSPDDDDEQVTKPPSKVSVMTSQQACSPTQPNKDNDNLMNLPQPSCNTPSVKADQSNRPTAVTDDSPRVRSFIKV